MNKALVAKLAWQVYKESNKIWVQLIRSKYLRGRKLLDVESIPTRASWIWGSITKCLNLLKEYCCYQIGALSTARIMVDQWLPSIKGFRVLTHFAIPQHIFFVRDLMHEDKPQWDIDKISSIFPPQLSRSIIHTLILHMEHDRLVWAPSTTGDYTVKTAYQEVINSCNQQTKCGTWKQIWKLHYHGRHNVFLWKLIANALPTLDKLSRFIPGISSSCYLCGNCIETTHHIFLECLIARMVWLHSPLQIDTTGFWDFELDK